MSRKPDVIGVVDALDPKQLQAIDLLAGGHTVTDAAEMVGVERETVSRWKTRDARFMAVLSDRRQLLWDASGDKLRNNLVKAADRVAALIDHEDPSVSLKAIEMLYKSLANHPHGGYVNRQSTAAFERAITFADWD